MSRCETCKTNRGSYLIELRIKDRKTGTTRKLAYCPLHICNIAADLYQARVLENDDLLWIGREAAFNSFESLIDSQKGTRFAWKKSVRNG